MLPGEKLHRPIANSDHALRDHAPRGHHIRCKVTICDGHALRDHEINAANGTRIS